MNHAESDEANPLFARYAPRASSRNSDQTIADGFVIRPALANDLPEIARLIQQRDGGTIAHHQQRLEQQLVEGETRWHIDAAFIAEKLTGFGRCAYFDPPANSPANTAPRGWYLAGVIVDPEYRRLGIGLALTKSRLQWLVSRSDEVFYFANARNRPTIDLHSKLGFTEVTRDFVYPGAAFTDGVGILFRARLSTVGERAE